jgi:hypothetical protein
LKKASSISVMFMTLKEKKLEANMAKMLILEKRE